MVNFPSGDFIDPEKAVLSLGVEKGWQVADFGCGAGYFSVAFAKAVGEEGVVYALDVLLSALESVGSRAKMAGLHNVNPKRVNLEKENGTGLDNGSMDAVFAKDIFSQSPDKESIAKEAHRVLKKGGKLWVIEWDGKDSTVGPPAISRLKKDDLKALLESRGFRTEEIGISTGNSHYSLMAVK